MSGLSPKERLLKVLRKEKVDRPPVVCAGGMMNAAVVEVMKKTGHTVPEAHNDSRLMAELAHDVCVHTGFENLGIPFDVTVEAQAMGSAIDFGTLICEPKIAKERFSSVSEAACRNVTDLIDAGRIPVIVQAAYLLSRAHPDVPVIGNITGPITTAASVIDPVSFLKDLRRDKENSHRVIDCISNFLIRYGRLLVGNGADLICIADPTASGEILGPKTFAEYATKYLNKIIDSIHAMGAPVIVHICGKMKTVQHLIPAVRSDAISVDAVVSIRSLKQAHPGLTTMGNISTYVLESGTPVKIARITDGLIRDGVDIISPACGLSTSTSLQNIRAMTDAVTRN